MKLIRRKISAFTIFEVIVTIIISSIILYSSIALFLFIQRKYDIFITRNNNYTDFSLFSLSFQNDINYYQFSTIDNNTIVFRNLNDTNKSSYIINENFIVRTSLNENDTFNLSVEQKFYSPIKDILFENDTLFNKITIHFIINEGQEVVAFHSYIDINSLSACLYK